jgi:hypothetical protein
LIGGWLKKKPAMFAGFFCGDGAKGGRGLGALLQKREAACSLQECTRCAINVHGANVARSFSITDTSASSP